MFIIKEKYIEAKQIENYSISNLPLQEKYLEICLLRINIYVRQTGNTKMSGKKGHAKQEIIQ